MGSPDAYKGLVHRVEIDAAAPLGHKLVILADTNQAASTPKDATSSSASGIRVHRASLQEQQNTIQALGGVRQLQAAVSATSEGDYKRKQAVTASEPTAAAFAGPNAPGLVQFEP